MLDFNFFEPYLDPPVKPNYSRLVWLILFSTVFLVIVYLQFDYMGQKAVTQGEIDLNRQFIDSPDVREKIAAIDEQTLVYQKLESITSDLSVFELIMSVKGQLQVGLFDLINQQVPEYVYISAMNLTANQVIISGYSDSYQSIALFQHQLRKVDRFSDVFVPSIVEDQGNYIFTINATFKLEVPNENK